MLVEQAIYKLLVNDPGVSAFVSTRIYPGVLKQSITYPAIAFRITGREHVIRLESRASSGLARTDLSVYVAQDGTNGYLPAKRIAEAVRLALHGYVGTVYDTTVSPQTSIEIRGIFTRQTFDLYDDPSQTYQVLTEFDVWASEAQPA